MSIGKKATRISMLLILAFFPCALAAGQECTQVIGYSQVGAGNGGWFTAGEGGVSNFEQIVGDEVWQLLWNGGAGVDKWKDPNYIGWSNNVNSSCSSGALFPDRVLLSVSGPHGTDVGAWVSDIQASVDTIRDKYPATEQIILQPVVGGPSHQTCFIEADSVRASWQHDYIDRAIQMVAEIDLDVSEGCSPEVNSCTDYSDTLGHLKPEAAQIVGTSIGQCYNDLFSVSNERPTDLEPAFQLYPNPSASEVTFRIEFPVLRDLSIYEVSILNTVGQIVKSLAVSANPTRITNIVWDGTNDAGVAVSSGIYFLVLDSPIERHTLKLVRVRS